MGYMHIDNLYKNTTILQESHVYALEKIHGTSSHLMFRVNKSGNYELLHYSGGERMENFARLFDEKKLLELYGRIFGASHPNVPTVVVYGEAHGGKQQRMAETYGVDLDFIAFDVKVDGRFLDVPQAERVVHTLGLKFVDYALIAADLSAIDAERDKPSSVALAKGLGEKPREGVVLRPVHEKEDHRGNRIIVKHKRPEFRETHKTREVDPEKLEKLTEATAIAEEWVTPMRLQHVLGRLEIDGRELSTEDIPTVIKAMLEDVEREATGEVEMSKEARKQIGKTTVALFKKHLNQRLYAKEQSCQTNQQES